MNSRVPVTVHPHLEFMYDLTYLVKRWGLNSAWELPRYVLMETVHILRTKLRRRALLTRRL